MSIFTKIKDAIFGKKEETPNVTLPKDGVTVGSGEPIREVDVVARLNAMPGSDRLNWRTSIVDLMKLIGLDASYAERKELAQELGRPDYSGTAGDNIWLHDRVMEELAKNGGKVPEKLQTA